MTGRVHALLRSTTYALLLTLPGLPVSAQQAGDRVSGVIAEVDGRSITVDREGGGRVTARLGPKTQVVVQSRQGGHYPNTSPAFLKPGMGVAFTYAAGPLDRVQVTNVPAARSSALSGRITRVDARAGRLVVEVDGKESSYTVEDRALLDGLESGARIRFDVEERSGGRSVVVAIR